MPTPLEQVDRLSRIRDLPPAVDAGHEQVVTLAVAELLRGDLTALDRSRGPLREVVLARFAHARRQIGLDDGVALRNATTGLPL